MHRVALSHREDFEGWRNAARALAMGRVPPAEIVWQVLDGAAALLATEGEPLPTPAEAGIFSVPRPFLALAETVVRHSDPVRFDLLYQLLDRLRSRPDALGDASDPLIQRLEIMAREVRREMAERSRGKIGDNAQGAWEAVRAEAMSCTRCHLYKCATQTVFGEGPVGAKILFVGEQPGDQEDLAGRPFVGPAGQMFDKALAEAEIDRRKTYVTNAVKHFKFEQRGKRRIHQKPEGPEIEACRWWIEQERLLIRPPITVALGATAARSLFGKVVTISGMRGRAHNVEESGETWVTVHPSFLLRIPEPERKESEYRKFVADLARLKKRLAEID